MEIIELIRRQPKPLITVFGFLLVGLLGIADYVTGPELFFLEFYLLPVFLVAWFAGETAGVLVSICSAVAWFTDDVVGRNPFSTAAIPYWNVAIKFVVFVIFVHMVLVFKDAIERERAAEQERIRREMEIAREVQERMFPQFLPSMKTLDYTGICKPAYGIGGDYYDFLPLSKQQFGIALGDISGKGISSALLMANLQATLRSHAFQQQEDIAELMRVVNRALCASTQNNKFATFFYGLYDEATRTLTYVNAGHNPPMLFRPLSDQSESFPATM